MLKKKAEPEAEEETNWAARRYQKALDFYSKEGVVVTFDAKKATAYLNTAKADALVEELKDKPLDCKNCGEQGHMARDCKAGPRCRKCQQLGHMARDCSEGDTCHRCGQTGHKASGCTESKKPKWLRLGAGQGPRNQPGKKPDATKPKDKKVGGKKPALARPFRPKGLVMTAPGQDDGAQDDSAQGGKDEWGNWAGGQGNGQGDGQADVEMVDAGQETGGGDGGQPAAPAGGW